jgi:hypothetical protein
MLYRSCLARKMGNSFIRLVQRTLNGLIREYPFYWVKCFQTHLFRTLCAEFNSASHKLEQLIHILEWIQLDWHLPHTGQAHARPTKDRLTIACAFVAKAVLNLGTTWALIDRLNVAACFNICGFEAYKPLPSKATFSRAFKTFAESNLAEYADDAPVKDHLRDHIIGHLSRDAMAIHAR